MSETGSSDFDKNLLIQVRNELLATVEKKEEKEEPLMIPTVPMGENGMGEKNTAIVYFFHGSGNVYIIIYSISLLLYLSTFLNV